MDDTAQMDTGFEGYPDDYVSHNLPLIVLSGLAESPPPNDTTRFPPVYDGPGTEIESELPLVSDKRAGLLLAEFQSCEKTDDDWSSRPIRGKSTILGFKFRAVGRDFTLPPHKAGPPSEALGIERPQSSNSKSPPPWSLHSPVSPLTPASPLFPDGLMTPLWVAKHQHLVPSVFISFFDFTSDPARNSLLDNQLKSEISNIKAALYRSEYKTRYVVVLLSDKTILQAQDIEDRLANIRRATGLDPKNGFFFLPPSTSKVEVVSFVDSLLSTLQPVCVEYYRDLTKHARRKKNRGSIPLPTAPPTRGTSQTLAAIGWAVRYDFKLGVFAEFRQEMDAACRHYNSCLEVLLGQDGVFETTASWSPRWDEARLLADTVAFRIIRCLLWSSMTTTAVDSWQNYRDRWRELIDRRGKGTANYGWEAWESRWTRIMAELIRRSRLAIFSQPDRAEVKIYAPLEKSIPVGERIPPWHHLHQPGYWWRQAAKYTWRRRRRALEIPEEDRTPPGQSPASAMASRYGTYETYLCPEPHHENPLQGHQGYDHSKDIISALDKATGCLLAQPRATDEVLFDKSKEFMRTQQHDEALSSLFHLWEQMAWRRDQWWRLVYEVTRNLHECARIVGDAKVVAATEFELYNSVLPLSRKHQYDLLECTSSLSQHNTHSRYSGATIELSRDKVSSFLSTSIVFASLEGNAGEPLLAQLTLVSSAHQISAPVKISEVTIQLEGLTSHILIRHSQADAVLNQKSSRLQTLSLEDSTRPGSPPSYLGQADLTISAGQTIILEFPLVFREAGPVEVSEIILSIATSRFTLNYSTRPEDDQQAILWWKQGTVGPCSRRLHREDGPRIQILPRPPKMELTFPRIEKHFYTDETVRIDIEVANLEDEDTEATLEARLLTRDGPNEFVWLSSRKSGVEELATENAEIDLPGHVLGMLIAGARKTETIEFTAPPLPTEYVIEVKVLYHLLSDRETPVSRTHSENLNITRAFEANYDLQPRIHPEPWPTFFSASSIPISEEDKSARGITQRWHLSSSLASFAYEGLIIEDLQLDTITLSGGATLTWKKHGHPEGDTEIAPEQQIPRDFVIEIRKASLEDRRATTVDLGLIIRWRRPEAGSVAVTSTIPGNSYTLPNSEPRVLAVVSRPEPITPTDEDAVNTPDAVNPSLIALTYTLENPTTHFLTFDLNMEISETFAFSGPAVRTLNLLPLSRESIQFVLMPMGASDQAAEPQEDGGDKGGTWLDVRYKVVDRYFKKVLRILAASEGIREGVKNTKSGVLSIWVPETDA
ncbi:hypothetical protein FKW77_005731 [Venturia effusa]|uniref:Trafficking protein particle complex subunit 11 domain-containing protein n=1 Tax=Venturia effusa TaxID=50376 RepID=A0A517LFI2_9PEZI|nr:hypothetical protein FKW77_005731 [Venturia effusa]